jgi:replicative DNA helicase
LIVVDYIQLLREVEGDGRTRERNVSAAARGLKDLSGELGLPLLALVQLNRNRATRIDIGDSYRDFICQSRPG